MQTVLQKTITVKQLMILMFLMLLILFSCWVYTLYSQRWRMQMGGVVGQKTSIYASIPEPCKAYAMRSMGGHIQSNLEDALMLRYRVHRWQIPLEGQPFGLLPNCLGYAVLAGANGTPPGEGNFTEIYADGKGQDVMEIRVRYYKKINEGMLKNANAIQP